MTPELADISSELARCLLALPAGDRDALLLVAWGELSYEETATALGVPIGTVRSRIARARRRLSLGLEPGGRDGASTAGLSQEERMSEQDFDLAVLREARDIGVTPPDPQRLRAVVTAAVADEAAGVARRRGGWWRWRFGGARLFVPAVGVAVAIAIAVARACRAGISDRSYGLRGSGPRPA